jgi:ribokinase
LIVVVGSVNLDTVVHVDHVPRTGETIIATDRHLNPGGKGANQAVAAARLGAEVVFIGCVGDDQAGRDLRSGLIEEGVDCSLLDTVDGPSGSATVIVDREGDNAIVVAEGANARVAIDTRHAEALRSATAVLCQLEVPLAAAGAALAMAGGHAVLNAAPSRALPADVIGSTDVLIVNEIELADLAGGIDPRAVRSLGVRTVVATLGGEGAQVIAPGDVVYVPAPSVTVRDTTGAGDAFCGAFAWALDAGLDVHEATVRGVVAGSLATTGVGARTAMPKRTAVDRMLRAGS